MMSANHSIKTRAQARKSKAWRDAMDLNESRGQYFFDKVTMHMFGSVLVGIPYTLPYDDRTYFVTGEDSFNKTERLYTVRVLDKTTGKVDDVGEFGQYKTPMSAIAARNEIVGYM